MSDISDGLSNTLMVADMLPGKGDNNSPGKYPYDVFYTNNGLFTSVANKDFPSLTELNNIGTAAKSSPSGVRGNNGGMWAWYAAYHSTLNTAAPPNWQYPSAGGDCCPGGAHDWGYGILPPRSAHTGGVNAALGDGSVRFIRDSVDILTFQRVGNGRDGGVLGDF
jgi:prepilin-type processing-associated H-X9-DG protein